MDETAVCVHGCPTFLAFLMEGCGPCNRFKVELAKLQPRHGRYHVARFDSARHRSIAEGLGVRFYPTVAAAIVTPVKDGMPKMHLLSYEGPRTAADMEKWIDSRAYISAKPLNVSPETLRLIEKHLAKSVV